MHSGTIVKCMKIAKDECTINNVNAEHGIYNLLSLKQNCRTKMIPIKLGTFLNELTKAEPDLG